jgi:hypothetical protein
MIATVKVFVPLPVPKYSEQNPIILSSHSMNNIFTSFYSVYIGSVGFGSSGKKFMINIASLSVPGLMNRWGTFEGILITLASYTSSV